MIALVPLLRSALLIAVASLLPGCEGQGTTDTGPVVDDTDADTDADTDTDTDTGTDEVWTGLCAITDDIWYGDPASYALVVTFQADAEVRVHAVPDSARWHEGDDYGTFYEDGGRRHVTVIYQIDLGYYGAPWTFEIDGEVDGDTWTGTCSCSPQGSYGIYGCPGGTGPFTLTR